MDNTFAHPQIQEVIGEIHFELSEWKETFPSDFFKYVQDEYPQIVPMQGMGLQLRMGPDGVTQSYLPQKQLFRYQTSDKSKLLQLSEDRFLSLNYIGHYPGWDTMEKDLKKYWGHCLGVISPDSINKLGLRYINRILKLEKTENVGTYLKENEYIPEAILKASTDYIHRLEIQKDPNTELELVIADIPDSTAIIFDITCSLKHNLSADADSIITQFNAVLRPYIKEIWNNSRTDRYNELLSTGK